VAYNHLQLAKVTGEGKCRPLTSRQLGYLAAFDETWNLELYRGANATNHANLYFDPKTWVVATNSHAGCHFEDSFVFLVSLSRAQVARVDRFWRSVCHNNVFPCHDVLFRVSLLFRSPYSESMYTLNRETHALNHSVARQCLHCCKIDQPILWR